MGEIVGYETPICCLRRLTQGDNSDQFIFHLKFNNSNDNTFDICTTVNKARVISKKVNEIIQIDPTLNEYEIKLDLQQQYKNKETAKSEMNEVCEIFEKLLRSTEEKITIARSSEHIIQKLRFLLGETIEDGVKIEIKSIEEAISYLRTSHHDFSISFLSTRMKELIKSGEFFKLEEKIANEIIDSYFIQQTEESKQEDENEDSEIFDCLKNNGKENENEQTVMHFLLQIEASKNTKEMREYVLDHLSDEIVNNELGQIIRQFRDQLQSSQNIETKENPNASRIKFKGDELNGIFSYMRSLKGDKLIESGELIISSGKSAYHGSLENIIKYDKDHINDYFQNNDGSMLTEKEGWIEFDFVDRKVNLTSYTIRSSNNGVNGAYNPKTWRFVGSNDRISWDLLNKQTNNSELNDRYRQHRFECERNSNYYRYIRYIQEDAWFPYREYCICLTCIELFGSILNISGN